MENENAVDEFSVYINDIPIQLQAEVYFDYTTISKNVRSMEEDCCDGKESEVYFYHSALPNSLRLNPQ